MSKRSHYLSAIGTIVAAAVVLVLSPVSAFAEKRVALIVGNSTYQAVPQIRGRGRSGRCRGHLLRRSRHRNRRHELPGSHRCASGQRPRRRRRGDSAGASGVVRRWREKTAGHHSRRLPRQSVHEHDAAERKMASLNDQLPAQTVKPGNIVVAAVGPGTIAPGREPNSKEALDYDRVKETTDIDALRRFVKKYPDSPLSITVQQKIDVLTAAQQEREARARTEREAAQKAAEEVRLAAEKIRVERTAQRKREDDERRARAAEAERRKAELASAQEAQCQSQQNAFNDASAKAADPSTGDAGLTALKSFARTVICKRLRPQRLAENATSQIKGLTHGISASWPGLSRPSTS